MSPLEQVGPFVRSDSVHAGLTTTTVNPSCPHPSWSGSGSSVQAWRTSDGRGVEDVGGGWRFGGVEGGSILHLFEVLVMEEGGRWGGGE